MAKNKISDLRDHLFETLEALKAAENPMDIERAKAISDVAQTIINSAKVEIDLIRAVDGHEAVTRFFEGTEKISPQADRLPMPQPMRKLGSL